MQQYPDSPYYRMYTEQPPFPLPRLPLTPPPAAVDTSEPLTLYGGALIERQLQRSAHKAPTRWLMVSLVTLLGILAASSCGIAAMYVGAVEAAFIAAMAVVALVFAIYGYRQNAAQQEKVKRQRWKLYAAATDGGLTTVFYPDRVEQTSPRGREVVRFSPATRFTEYEDMLVLEDGTCRVALRAEDLTAEQAQAVYERICAVVPPEQQFAVGRFYAKRSEPAPPPFSTEPAMVFDRIAATQTTVRENSGLLWWGTAACFVMAGLLTVLFSITPYFWLDYPIVLAAVTLPSLGATLLWRPRTKTASVTLIVTGEGLVVSAGECERFVAAADVVARRTDNGARLFTPAGNFVFPWNATQNRQQIEWMLFGQR